MEKLLSIDSILALDPEFFDLVDSELDHIEKMARSVRDELINKEGCTNEKRL